MEGNCLYLSLLFKYRRPQAQIKIEFPFWLELFESHRSYESKLWRIRYRIEKDPRSLFDMFLPHFYLVYKNMVINFVLKDYTNIPLWYDLDVEIDHKLSY